MKKKRKTSRPNPKRDTDQRTRSAEDHAQRSDDSGRPPSKAKRAQRGRGSSAEATGLRRVMDLRLLMVVLLAAAAIAVALYV